MQKPSFFFLFLVLKPTSFNSRYWYMHFHFSCGVLLISSLNINCTKQHDLIVKSLNMDKHPSRLSTLTCSDPFFPLRTLSSSWKSVLITSCSHSSLPFSVSCNHYPNSYLHNIDLLTSLKVACVICLSMPGFIRLFQCSPVAYQLLHLTASWSFVWLCIISCR